MIDERSGDVSGAWCADSGISSSSSIATVSSDKLSLSTGSAAAAGSRRRTVDDGDDDDNDITGCRSTVRHWRRSSAADTDSPVATVHPPPAGLTICTTSLYCSDYFSNILR